MRLGHPEILAVMLVNFAAAPRFLIRKRRLGLFGTREHKSKFASCWRIRTSNMRIQDGKTVLGLFQGLLYGGRSHWHSREVDPRYSGMFPRIFEFKFE